MYIKLLSLLTSQTARLLTSTLKHELRPLGRYWDDSRPTRYKQSNCRAGPRVCHIQENNATKVWNTMSIHYFTILHI